MYALLIVTAGTGKALSATGKTSGITVIIIILWFFCFCHGGIKENIPFFSKLQSAICSVPVSYTHLMGCRTGNYLLLAGDSESRDIVPLMIEMFEFIRDFEGEIPGASAKDCGNYLDMNPGMAKYLANKYLNDVLYDIRPDRLTYPE